MAIVINERAAVKPVIKAGWDTSNGPGLSVCVSGCNFRLRFLFYIDLKEVC